MLFMVAIFASSMLLSDSAHAQRALPAIHRASDISNNPFAAFVTEASKRFGVPEHWIRTVLQVEGDGKLRARSPKGAPWGSCRSCQGPGLNCALATGLDADPYNPHDNILAAAAYIRELHDRYGSPGFLAAYNAGASALPATGRPIPEQTQAHVATLAPKIEGKQTDGKIAAVAKSLTWAGSPLFAVRTARNSTVDRLPRGVHPDHPLSDRAVVDLSALMPQSDNLFVRRAGKIRSPRSRSRFIPVCRGSSHVLM
jgi:hypothetical protein